MWNNHFSIITKANENTSATEVACSEATSTQFEDTFEFKKPYPPPLGRTYSRLRSLVDRPVKKFSPSPKIHFRPSPGLHFLETFRQRQRSKLRKFQSFPSSPTSNAASISLPPASISSPSLWSTSTSTSTLNDVPVPSTANSSNGSDSLPEFPPLRRSKAISLLSRSFPAPVPTRSSLNDTGGIKRQLEFSSSNEDNERNLESSFSAGHEMEICYNYTSSEETCKARTKNEFPIPTLNSGEVACPVFQPRSPPQVRVLSHEMDSEDGNNNETLGEEYHWPDEQLDPLESDRNVFRFEKSNTKELKALETGKPRSKINVRAWLENNRAGFSFPTRREQRRLNVMTCDQAEGVAVREGHKDTINEKVKVIKATGKLHDVDKV